MPQHPLTEAKLIIRKFLDSKTSTSIDLAKVLKLIEAGQKEIVCLTCKTKRP